MAFRFATLHARPLLAPLLAALLLGLAGAAHAQTSPVYDAARDAGASPATAASLSAAMADHTEEALLRASNAGAYDYFGVSVALSGDRAIVGAYGEGGPTNATSQSGAAYVFELSGGTWSETALLRASNAGERDYFGFSVALSGDRALVGAYREDGPSNATPESGAAYVFELSGGTWSETALLRASNAEENDRFGRSVALSGDRAIVGAFWDEGTGAAYVFELSGGAWSETALLRASNAGGGDQFGGSVALSGDRAIVGAHQERGPGDATAWMGAAYVFELSGGTWTETALLRASNAWERDQFGTSVALSGDRAIVGAPYEDGPGDAIPQSGAAYVFELSGGTWTETAVLRASNADKLDKFGVSVALSGDRALVGAHAQRPPGIATTAPGAAYVFDLAGGTWSETALLRASNAGAGDEFGVSVGLSGDRSIIGAHLEDGPGNATAWMGAAYVFYVNSVNTVSIAIDGLAGFRLLGSPAVGVTVDALAAQSLVRGVPGYRPTIAPNLWTRYDAATSAWVPSTGTGETLQPGHAFWWFFPSDEIGGDIRDPFTLRTTLAANTADVDITLDTAGDRYNLLANPFGVPLDLSALASWPGSGNVLPVTWIYDLVTHGWIENPGVIEPWVGFRVRARVPRVDGTPRTLTIPAPSGGARLAASASATLPPEPSLAFTLTGTTVDRAPLADRALTLVFSDAAQPGFDAEEDAEKFQVPAERYALVGARAGEAFLGLDVRPFAEAEIPLAVEARGTASTFTLAWDASTLPSGLPVVLVDLVTGTQTNVRSQSSVTFEVAPLAAYAEVPTGDLADGTAATDRFVLRIGAGRASGEEAVTQVEMTGIAPNPSAGSAHVMFALPEAGAVRLTVVDLLGREVAVLADGTFAAGSHHVDVAADRLAAGVYVVHLQAGTVSQTTRFTVVR